MLPAPSLRVASLVLGLVMGSGMTSSETALAGEHDRARQALEAGTAQPLGAILAAIGRRHPGRALEARVDERDDKMIYRIKWLQADGQVRFVSADAQTGKILDIR